MLLDLEILIHDILYALLTYLVHACTTEVKKCGPREIYFLQKIWTKSLPEMSPSYSKNILLYFPSRKYKLPICSLSYTFVFVHNIFCIPEKDVWCMGNVHEIFSTLNFKITCIESFTCNDMHNLSNFSIYFKWNAISLLNVFFNALSLTDWLTDRHLRFDRILTDWLCGHP